MSDRDFKSPGESLIEQLEETSKDTNLNQSTRDRSSDLLQRLKNGQIDCYSAVSEAQTISLVEGVQIIAKYL